MIQPDVNVLVYAYRREAEQHALYADWLAELVAGPEELALVETVLTGFLRTVSNPRIFTDPAPIVDALQFVEVLRRGPRARPVHATGATWRAFAQIARTDRQLRANLVPDAWLAAMAISNGARLATADRGFARYDELNWFDPAAT